MLNLYVVRHGQTEANVEGLFNGLNDFDLTREGIAQANSLARQLKGKIKFFKIYCSPLKRAEHTAKILNFQKTKVLFSKLLIERDFGLFTLKPTSMVLDMSSLYQKGQNPISEIESYDSVCKRVEKFLGFLKRQNLDGNILVVTHGDIQFAFDDAFGKPYNHYPDNCEVFRFVLK